MNSSIIILNCSGVDNLGGAKKVKTKELQFSSRGMGLKGESAGVGYAPSCTGTKIY